MAFLNKIKQKADVFLKKRGDSIKKFFLKDPATFSSSRDKNQADPELKAEASPTEVLYIKPIKRVRIPSVIIAVVVLMAILTLVFWVLPSTVAQYFQKNNVVDLQEKPVERIYKDNIKVVKESVVDLMENPGIDAKRVAQVLYNEPLEVINQTEDQGYYFIKTMDGIEGYVQVDQVTSELDSIEPNLHLHKLIVSDSSKNIKSHIKYGTLLIEVMMNTVLYADEKRDGAYRVILPDGGKGWIGSSGVVEVDVNKSIDEIGVRYFVSSVLSFVNVTQLDKGLSKTGMSVDGLAYISANVNGVFLPRLMEEQIRFGKNIPLLYDPVTKLLDISIIQPGDLIFFADPTKVSDPNQPYEMGIYTDEDTLLMRSNSKTTLRLYQLSQNETLLARIISIRRIFKEN